MTKLAIFTAPKPFITPHITTIQHNAVQSWKVLGEHVEVWLVGDEPGVKEVSAELGVGFIPDVLTNNSGTPQINSIFNLVRKLSNAEYLCYVNADILLFADLLSTLTQVQNSLDRFLIIGRRWDANITERLSISEGWQNLFIPEILDSAKLHSAAGSDYFIFPRSEFVNIPEFSVGRAGWDNWMIYHGRCEKMAVVDATNSITAIHQNHDFSHFSNGKIHRLQPESTENVKLAGGKHTIFTIHDSNFSINNGMVKKVKMNRWRLIREFSIFPSTHLKWNGLAKIMYYIFNYRLIQKQKKNRKKKMSM